MASTVFTVITRPSRAIVAISAGFASGPASTTTIGWATGSGRGTTVTRASATAATKLATAQPRQNPRRVHHGPGVGVRTGSNPSRNAMTRHTRGDGVIGGAASASGESRCSQPRIADGDDGVGLRDARQAAARASRQRAQRVFRGERVEPGKPVGARQVHSARA